MTPAELAGGFGVPTTTTVSGQIEDHYLRRVQALPERRGNCCCSPPRIRPGMRRSLWRAARALGIGRDAAAAADSEQLLEIGSRVRFRHPLVRSAAYAAATPEDRARRTSRSRRRPIRRTIRSTAIWHLAAAATGSDEDVASELERAAGQAQARAGLPAAAAFLQRSVALTAEPRAARRPGVGRGPGPSARRRVRRRPRPAWPRPPPPRSTTCSVPASSNSTDRSRRPRDPDARRRLGCCRPRRRLEDARRAARPRHLPPGLVGGGPRRSVRGTGRRPARGLHGGACGPAGRGPSAVRPAPRGSGDGDHRGASGGGTDAAARNRSVSHRSGFRRRLDPVGSERDDGRLRPLGRRQLGRVEHPSGGIGCARPARSRPLVLALNFHAVNTTFRGDFEAATSLVAEQNAVKEVTGIRMASYGAQMLAAYRVGRRTCRHRRRRSRTSSIERGDGYALEVASWATALLNNGLGRYADALAAARETAYRISFCCAVRCSAELIEAAVRTGQIELANERLADALRPDRRRLGLGGRHRSTCRALLSVGEVAEHWYSESIA